MLLKKFIDSNTVKVQKWGLRPFSFGTQTSEETKTEINEEKLIYFRNEILGFVAQALNVNGNLPLIENRDSASISDNTIKSEENKELFEDSNQHPSGHNPHLNIQKDATKPKQEKKDVESCQINMNCDSFDNV